MSSCNDANLLFAVTKLIRSSDFQRAGCVSMRPEHGHRIKLCGSGHERCNTQGRMSVSGSVSGRPVAVRLQLTLKAIDMRQRVRADCQIIDQIKHRCARVQ